MVRAGLNLWIQLSKSTALGKIERIIVDETNDNYTFIDGILFNKEKTELIRYPEGKTGNTYKIPASVTSIGVSAFGITALLKTVTFTFARLSCRIPTIDSQIDLLCQLDSPEINLATK